MIMFSVATDSTANNTSKMIMGNLFGYQFEITLGLFITILVILVAIIVTLSVKNYLCKDKVTTFITRTSTETTIEQTGRNPITITQTQTVKYDIPSNLNLIPLWSPFVQGLRFAVVEDQGKREHMENSTNICDMGDNNNYHKKISFSLFDGHLGDDAAKFCTQHLPQYVSQFIDDMDNNNGNDYDQDNDDDDIAAAIRKAFHKTDQEFKKYAFENQCDAGAVGVYAYYDYDNNKSSSKKPVDCIYVANVGDCRAILCSDGKIEQLTIDHNPKNPLEKERCGDCIKDNSDLLSGQISVTRAIGDYSARYVTDNDDESDWVKIMTIIRKIVQIVAWALGAIMGLAINNKIYQHKKLKGLSCNPHITRHKLQDKDEFLIIACDGLWDVVSNQEAKAECRRSLRKDGDCNKAAQKLIKFAKAKSNQHNFDQCEEAQTSDNISVMVIGFANKSKDGTEHIGPKRESLTCGRLGRRRRFGSK